ncbi:MAG: hypothetical protein ACU84J_06335 [Gammaproteobacteria bacterium]
MKNLEADRTIAAAAVFALVVATITPLCGLLFQCGCDWPGFGLDAGCNYYRAHAVHRCPWCASLATGILSVVLAVGTGVAVAGGIPGMNRDSRASIIVFRILGGLSAFVAVAVLAAAYSAFEQHYPLGIGYFFSHSW